MNEARALSNRHCYSDDPGTGTIPLAALVVFYICISFLKLEHRLCDLLGIERSDSCDPHTNSLDGKKNKAARFVVCFYSGFN